MVLNKTIDLDISQIRVFDNIRATRDDENDDLADLMDSIKKNGLMQPIGVQEEADGEYLLLWGWRRMTAFTKLGRNYIPAIIFRQKDQKLSEEDFIILNASENLQRKDVTGIELGRICNKLKKTMSQGEIAVKLSIPKTKVRSAIETFGRIPKGYGKNISISGVDGRRKGTGQIGLNIASTVVGMRYVTDAEKKDILKKLKKGVLGQTTINTLKQMLAMGVPYKTAIKKIKQYRSSSLKILFNNKVYSRVMSSYDSQTELIKDAVNAMYPDLIF